MTTPETDALGGPSIARLGRVAKCPVEPVPEPSRELARMQRWPLQSHLELPAEPSAARSARLHTTSVLRRWRLEGLADTAELLASEIITNAVRASITTAGEQRPSGQAAPAHRLRFWLTSNRRSVLIQVWDGDHHPPVRKEVGPDAEAGRGVLLIDALSAQWGWYAPPGLGGKIVWAVCA